MIYVKRFWEQVRVGRAKMPFVELCLFAVAAVLIVRWGLNLRDWVLERDTRERTGVVTGVATVIGGTALLFGLYFTAKNVKNAQKAVEVSQESLRVSQRTLDNSQKTLILERRSKDSERFFRAVEMLGDETSIHIRTGALYALGALVRESEQEREQSLEIVMAYLSRVARTEQSLGDDRVLPDVQAAVDVLALRSSFSLLDSLPILNCSGMNLNRVDFKSGWFPLCDFSEAILTHANFDGCFLESCNFAGAKCHGASFRGAALVMSSFRETDLSYAVFYDAGADVYEVYGGPSERYESRSSYVLSLATHAPGERLAYASFIDATLNGANFMQVNLEPVSGMTRQQFESSSRSKLTIPPSRFWDPNEEPPF